MANLIGDKTYQQWEDSFKNAYMSGGVDAEVAARQAYADAANRMSNPSAPATTYQQIQNPTNSIVGGIDFGQTTQPGQSTAQPAGGFTVGGVNPVETGQNKPMQIGRPGAPATPGATGGSGGAGGFTVGGGTQGGIINSAIKPWEVTKDQTVAGNIEQITSQESPLIQQARTRAAQQMGARGLINSSLAATAADSAVYDVANTIAQADAATRAKAAGYNVDQLNQQVTLDKQLANQMSQAQLSADTSRYSTDVNASTQRLNNESAQLIARLNNDQQATLQRMQNDNQRLLQTNQQAAQAYNNSMQYIDVINRDPNLDAAAKTRAQAQIYYNLQTQLRTLSAVSGIDVTQSLSLANAPGFDAQGNYVGFDEAGNTRKPA